MVNKFYQKHKEKLQREEQYLGVHEGIYGNPENLFSKYPAR